MLTPVGEHELLLFWLQLALLLAVARGLGALMQRVGQPAVIGELGAGLLIGPTILGRVAPGIANRLFQGGEIESALVLGVAWLGIALLLTVTGFETDLGLLRIRLDEDPSEAIIAEAKLGYDLLAVGLNEGFAGTHELSEVLQRILAETPVPVLLVRSGTDQRGGGELRRLLVPITGTEVGRAAEEVAYTIASRLDAQVDAVHIVAGDRRAEDAPKPVEKQFERTRTLADRFGTDVSAVLRTVPVAYEELLTTAGDRDSDLIVLGAQVRSHEGRPFLGHGTEFLLERAPQAVLVAVFPPAR